MATLECFTNPPPANTDGNLKSTKPSTAYLTLGMNGFLVLQDFTVLVLFWLGQVSTAVYRAGWSIFVKSHHFIWK